MMLRLTKWLAPVAALAVLLLVIPAQAGDVSAAPADRILRFFGSGHIVVTDAAETRDGLLLTFEIRGQATPVGAYTGGGLVVLTREGRLSDGRMRWIDAHQNQLHLSFEGAVDERGFINGVLHVVDGTGRYEDAVGRAVLSGIFDLRNMTADIRFLGGIIP